MSHRYDEAMKSFYSLENSTKKYEWGHEAHIPLFLQNAPQEGTPVAELWMGAHVSSPSFIQGEEGRIGLDEAIASDLEHWLGTKAASRFGRLPFLYKLLAAGKSLSIQAHPDKAMAEEGFARENAAGVPLDARERNYKDDNHKPEILMALTPFSAMIGFREESVIRRTMRDLCSWGNLPLPPFAEAQDDFLRNFLQGLLTAPSAQIQALIDAAVAYVKETECSWDDLQKQWVVRLNHQFPGDAGVLSPLFLNVLSIAPGQALYQPARMLHAYLDGFGVELMANSDNVLRGGLTPKNVDVQELTRVLDFRSSKPEVLLPQEVAPGFSRFSLPIDEFSLSLLDGAHTVCLEAGEGPRMILVLEGQLTLSDGQENLVLCQGESAVLPSQASVTVHGKGKAAMAGLGQ
ncbi:MAG: mannose-6-phosphate isomerase, class I [Spirochaetales bacterium]|nr:mannose-6-phosphate isomerase, class I [Spirochaetales bacterium]